MAPKSRESGRKELLVDTAVTVTHRGASSVYVQFSVLAELKKKHTSNELLLQTSRHGPQPRQTSL